LLSDGEDEFVSRTKSKTRDDREHSESAEVEDVDLGAARSPDEDNAEPDSMLSPILS